MVQVLQRGLWQGNEPGAGPRGTGDKVSIDKELMEAGKVTEGGKEEGCEWRDQIGGCGDFL